jgi:CHAT domain-containing protein
MSIFLRQLKLLGLFCLGLFISLWLHLTPLSGFQPAIATPTPPDASIALGRQSYQAGQFHDAIRNLEQVAQAYSDRHDLLNQAIALTYLALSYQQQGQLQLAQTTITQSLSFVPETGGSRSQQQVRAQARTAQGQIQLASGQPEQALKSWQQAQSDYQNLDDRMGELGTQINQIQALRSIGFYRWAQDQIKTLESQLNQSSDPELQILGWRSLGNLLQTTGQLEDAQSVLNTSWEIAQTLPAHSEQADANRAAILLGLGNTEAAFGDRQLKPQPLRKRENCLTWNAPEAAAAHYSQAIQYYQRSADQAPATLLAVKAQLNSLNLQLKLGQSVAASNIQSIYNGIIQLPASRPTIYAKINFAKSLFCYSQANSVNLTASEILESAIQQAQQLKDDRAYTYALGSLGQIDESVGKVDAAQGKTKQALALAQQIQAIDIAYQWEWQMARLFQNQDTEQALGYYKAAFTSLQVLRSDLTALNTDLQFSFRETVEPFYREYVDLLLKNPDQTHLMQSRAVIEALQIAELDDFFRDACSNAKPELLDEIADEQDSKAAIIYPILLSDRLEIILKLPGEEQLKHYVTLENERTIVSTLRTLREQLQLPYTLETLKQPANQVYHWLIQPLVTDLAAAQIQTLVFVLDSEFRNIPIAALVDGERYLIEQYAIATTPGLQLLEPQSVQEIQPRLFAGGLEQPNPDLAEDFVDLVNVPDELAAIQAIVPRSVQLLNDEFTKDRIRTTIQSQPISIVHFATHGRFSSNLSDTFILAYDTPVNVNELQTVLQNRSATNLDAIELLVLSACDTAKGDERATLGMAGIAVRSGARSTVASLWKADDEASAQLITEFYQQLFGESSTTNKAIALQKAQLSLLNDPKFQHPRNWAPFILLGNWL